MPVSVPVDSLSKPLQEDGATRQARKRRAIEPSSKCDSDRAAPGSDDAANAIHVASNGCEESLLQAFLEDLDEDAFGPRAATGPSKPVALATDNTSTLCHATLPAPAATHPTLLHKKTILPPTKAAAQEIASPRSPAVITSVVTGPAVAMPKRQSKEGKQRAVEYAPRVGKPVGNNAGKLAITAAPRAAATGYTKTCNRCQLTKSFKKDSKNNWCGGCKTGHRFWKPALSQPVPTKSDSASAANTPVTAANHSTPFSVSTNPTAGTGNSDSDSATRPRGGRSMQSNSAYVAASNTPHAPAHPSHYHRHVPSTGAPMMHHKKMQAMMATKAKKVKKQLPPGTQVVLEELRTILCTLTTGSWPATAEKIQTMGVDQLKHLDPASLLDDDAKPLSEALLAARTAKSQLDVVQGKSRLITDLVRQLLSHGLGQELNDDATEFVLKSGTIPGFEPPAPSTSPTTSPKISDFA